jgi:hypothetical protein
VDTESLRQRAETVKRMHIAQYQVKTAIMAPEGLFNEPAMREVAQIAFSKASFQERIAAIDFLIEK